MGIFKEFRDFAIKGNMIDMAVGIIIGGAFGAVVASLVGDVMKPPLDYIVAKTQEKAAEVAADVQEMVVGPSEETPEPSEQAAEGEAAATGEKPSAPSAAKPAAPPAAVAAPAAAAAPAPKKSEGWRWRVGGDERFVVDVSKFFTVIMGFLITAFAVFLLVKAINKARRMSEKEKAAAPPPEPTEEVVLLREIRDALKAR